MATCRIVIEIKFGDELRRFNAYLHKEELDFDMAMLREKICKLFGLASDVDFTLTYIDEDGDVVALCDDEDLFEVAAQYLNPVRITVKLNTDKLVKSTKSSDCLASLQDQLPFQTLDSSVSDILKYVPEPLHDAASKLLLDLAPKAASSVPVLAELMQKMQMTYMNKLSESQAGASDIKDQKGSKIDGASESLPSTHKVLVDAEVESSNSKNKAVQLQMVTEDVKFGDVQPSRPVDLNDPETFWYLPNGEHVKGSGIKTCENTKKDSENIITESLKSVGFGASYPDYLKYFHQDPKMIGMSCFPWLKTPKATDDSGSSSGWQQGMFSANHECPFTGMHLSSDATVHAYPYASHVPPLERSCNHGNGSGNIFPMGVRCDGCGVHPNIGPCFKSEVKDDAEYIRMDCPLISHHPSRLRGFRDHSVRVPPPEMKPSSSRLDSRFILDVNVLDGTIMAPSTRFTKIWRMRNNGDVIWPQGSQLLWIGGDMLSYTDSVEVEIPADGLPVGQELNIAVGFTAPGLPGKYVSYWRMASPSGQKFGQRVWVLIQVDGSMKNLDETSIYLNLPPGVESEDLFFDAQPHKNQEKNFTINDTLIVANGCMKNLDETSINSNLPPGVESEELFFDAQPHKDQEKNFAINGTLIVGNGGLSNTTATPTAASPTMNFPEVLPMEPNTVQSPSTMVQVQPAGSNLDQEQTLLRELEGMGFKHVDLNKEILRINEYNLEQSVHDLCQVLDWDPFHQELLETGLLNEEPNKRLEKNNGSIKHIVTDQSKRRMA